MILWTGFILVVLACLGLDLGAFRRRHAHGEAMRLGEAARWTTLWVAVGVGFSGVVYLIYERGWAGFALHTLEGEVHGDGGQAAALYLTAYLLEKSLSLDNLFVMALIFRSFSVPRVHQHRVLLWGILGAIVMRGLMIGGGLYLLERLTWVFYVFGAYLAYTGVKVMRAHADSAEASPLDSWLGRTVTRLVPVTRTPESDRFWVRTGGRLHLTQLFLCLVLIECTDVIFAIDSVPAVLAVSVDPFICYTSNIFAILGLRSLYFVLAEMLTRFEYLKHSLGVILVFIGAKLFFHHPIAAHVPDAVSIWGSLAFILVALTAGVLFSFKRSAPSEAPRVAHARKENPS